MGVRHGHTFIAFLAVAFSISTIVRGEVVEFKGDSIGRYRLSSPLGIAATVESSSWIWAQPEHGGQPVCFGPRIVLELTNTNSLPQVLKAFSLKLLRDDGSGRYRVGCRTPKEAINTARSLARLPSVRFAVPVRKNSARLHGPLAPTPNDPYYPLQSHLETIDRTTSFAPSGVDLNIREAWATTQGKGVHVALGDDGVDLQHPDLVANEDSWSFNFVAGVASGNHTSSAEYHGTAAAGLLAAVAGNRVGVAGVAPGVRFSSWVIFDENGNVASDDQLADMWQTANSGPSQVSVQSHSWGNSDTDFLIISSVESAAIQSAETGGRNGLGVVIVRSGGNNRARDFDGTFSVGDANLDQYANDPRQIAVAAVRPDGWAAGYSNPGACILVATPSGDFDHGFNGLVTTDPVGAAGENLSVDPNNPDAANYLSGLNGFSGTSAAAPQAAGLAALVLGVNPALSVRDVQQILGLSAHHPHRLDPELVTNSAGFILTHSLGFGVPNAGLMVELARRWTNRPVETVVHSTNTTSQSIPDDGFRLQIRNPSNHSILVDIPASGSLGLHPDSPGAWLPLVDGGGIDSPSVNHLNGSLTVVHRPFERYSQSIALASDAGAAAVVVLNDRGSIRTIMPGTDYVRIPAGLASESDGQLVSRTMATNSALEARFLLNSAQFTFPVKVALTVEHVQATLHWNHARSADLRVTLLSPSGTRSILHRPGGTPNPVPTAWTYSSVRHLGESSLGTWTVAITDEARGVIGSVDSVELHLSGVAIVDQDGDGLDDAWELRYFGHFRFGPRDDPDGDGWSNAVEHLMGTDPSVNDRPLQTDLSRQLPDRMRLSWPALDNALYSVESALSPEGPWSPFKAVPGIYPESLLFLGTSGQSKWFRVRSTP